jgi:predicted helicase
MKPINTPVDKMKFAKVRDENGKLVADKTRIIYNSHITIENIPLKAYEYIVNGNPPLTDNGTLCRHYRQSLPNQERPNDWSREHEQPRYILDLLLSVIMLSCQTVDIVNTLPILRF